MKNVEEMCYLSKHKDWTKVWYKSGFTDNKWELKEKVYWDGFGTYIVDDEWAELRKAQADGKQIQRNNICDIWVDCNGECKFNENIFNSIINYRIKPKEPIYEWQWIHQYINKSWDITSEYYTEPPLGRGYINLNKFGPSRRLKK